MGLINTASEPIACHSLLVHWTCHTYVMPLHRTRWMGDVIAVAILLPVCMAILQYIIVPEDNAGTHVRTSCYQYSLLVVVVVVVVVLFWLSFGPLPVLIPVLPILQ